MIKDPFIIECALKIAQWQKYPVLLHGMQLLDDYESEGKRCPGLETKLQREQQEFQEAYASYQTGEKSAWQVMHEAADLYYYARQIEAQGGGYRWPVLYQHIKHQLPMDFEREEVKKAAHAKYGWRSEQPGNKNEVHELLLIQDALSNAGPGRPPKEREPVAPINLVLPISLKSALNRANKQEKEQRRGATISEIVARELLKSDYIQRFLMEEE